jgi:plastocyanin
LLFGLLCAGCSNGPVDNCSATRCARDGSVDAASRDAATVDAADANRVDSGAVDASLDAGEPVDAGELVDTGTDAATDPGSDADVDAATDPGSDAGTDAATTPVDGGTDAATPVDAGTDAATPTVNGCTRATAMDLRGTASTSVAFGGALGISYSPRCIVVSVGTGVTFNGSFGGHPLEGGTVVGVSLVPATSGPFIPATVSGTTRTFTMGAAGTFPYYCQFHGGSGMSGVVYVE